MDSIAEVLSHHPLFNELIQVQSRLNQHQFVCWLAGGAVRDFLSGRVCDDFDLVTDASTENLKLIFPEALKVGEKFGVLKLILQNGKYFDITTFRQEADYIDGRRPSSVSASTPQQDALRRDFTMNALFYDFAKHKLIDHVDGLSDLKNKKIRAVGHPQVRFAEDYLRILRLVRFAAQFQFEIEPQTLQAARQNKLGLQKISAERIWAELKKLKKTSEWNFLIDHQLFQNIITVLFNCEFQLKRSGFKFLNSSDSLFHLIYFLTQLQIEESLLKKTLQKHLRLSNSEIEIVETFLIIDQFHHEWSKIELLAYDLEVKKNLKEVMSYLVHQQKFDSAQFEKALKILQAYPKYLIKGQDLLGLIPNEKIKSALKKIRCLQLSGLLKNKNEALDYIKNDLAISS